MPKIRGIKPEIWTDDKFVSLEDPFARLLFIGMWNFACDNGHLDDNPRQIKLRVLPADDVDAFALIESLVSEALVERRDGFLKITNLTQHQSPDLRFLIFCDHCDRDEHATFARSDKRERTKSARSAPSGRTTGAPRNGDVDGDGDGDGEKARSRAPRATRVDPDFAITDDMRAWAKSKGFGHLDLDAITEQFVDHWLGKSGKDATKVDWLATWRGWIRREDGFRGGRSNVARIEPRKGMPPEPCSTCGAPPEHGHYDGCPVAS